MPVKDVYAALRASAVFLLICGLLFPFAITAISQVAVQQAAEGTIVTHNDTVVGSSLVGQPFTDVRHFQSRPSGVSNWGPNNPDLLQNVSAETSYQKQINPLAITIPIDLVTQSGSGVDPHISKESALLQIPRVANATGVAPSELQALVNQNTEGRTVGIFGTERVNVLTLNLALDDMVRAKTSGG
ncbi:MAG: K(+)-transporting ATPase subunit C [Halobacteriota archaeon]